MIRAGFTTTSTRCSLDDGGDVYAYFNNDYDGLAVADAQWLRHAIDPGSRWG